MAQAHDKAAIHYELAVSLNPVSPKLLISAAQGMSFMGYAARARELLEEALHLAPFLLPYQWCYVCSTTWMIGRYEDALSAAQRGEFTTIDTYGWQAAALSRLGREVEASAAFAKLVDAVAPLWRAEHPADAAAVLAWFTQSFPIARSEDRDLLENCLRKALA
jgi:tetratricopeptide (TPR) repeat protein